MMIAPDHYIRTALHNAGVEVQELRIDAYSADAFGNLVASAQTSCGQIYIVYDRGFFLEGDHDWTGPSMIVLADALQREKRQAELLL